MARDPYRYFRIEARELLEQLSQAVLDAEKGAGAVGAEQVARMLRVAHTLKGAARVVKQGTISDLAHGVEDALAPYRDGAPAIPRECIDAVLAATDAMSARVAELPQPPGERAGAGETAAASLLTVRADIAEVDVLLEGLSEVHGELATLRRTLARTEHARHLTTLLAEQLASPRFSDAPRAGRQAEALARTRALTEELLGAIAGVERSAAGSLERVDRELRQAREVTERLRLLPAGTLFNALERLARDAAHSAGKRVVFAARGADVRLDGHVLEAMQQALVQIVRNAVAHGIEPEPERLRAGKPAEGRIELAVSRRGHRVSLYAATTAGASTSRRCAAPRSARAACRRRRRAWTRPSCCA
jgi:two-component system chemotaxis sensor kinase CheA